MYNKKLFLEAVKNLNGTPKMKKGGTKGFSSNLGATNRLFKKNGLFKKNSLSKPNALFKKPNYKGKTYDPSSMYFEEGGILELTPKEIEDYRKGGYIVEEINDPSIPMLNQFAKGGTDCGEGFTYDPKLGCIPESEESLTDEQKWMINWYKNRKIEFPEDQVSFRKASEKALPAYNPESPMFQQMKAFPVYAPMPEEYRVSDAGGYDSAGLYDETGKTPTIYYSPELTNEQRSDTEIHELTNHFMKPVRDKMYPMFDKIVEQNIIPFDENWPKEKQDFYDYVTDKDEQNIQSYLNVARKKFNLKPDEVVTPERLNKMREDATKQGMLDEKSKNFNPDIYLLFKMAKDDEGLMKWFNLIAQNKNESDVQYGKYGTQVESLQRFVKGGGPGDKYFKYQNTQYKKDPQGNWYKWNGKSWSAAGYGSSAYDLDQHIGLQDWEQAGRFQADDANWSNDKPKATIANYETERNKVLNNPIATTQQKIKATQAPLKSNVDLNKKLVEQKKQEDYLAEQEKLRKLQEEQRKKEEEEARLLNPNLYNSETLPTVARESGALLTKKEQDDFEAHKKDLGDKRAFLGRDYVHENYVALSSEEKNNAMYGLKGITWDDADKLAGFVLDDVVSGGYGYGLDDDLKAAFPNATAEQIKKYKDHITKARDDAHSRILNTVSNWDLSKSLKKRHYYDTPTRPEDNILKSWDKNDPNRIELSGRMPGTIGEWGTRVADIVANPLDAIHYGMSSTEEMPMNMYQYEKAKQQIGFEDGTDRNAVNEGLDFASWFTGAGTVAQGMKMLRPTGEAVYDFAKDPSWESAGTAALNVGFNALALSPLKPFIALPKGSTSAIVNPTSSFAAYAKLPGNRQILHGNPYLTEAESIINLPGFKLARGNAPKGGLPAMPVTPFNYTQNVGKTVLGLSDEATQGLLPTITEPHQVTESPLTVGTSAVPTRKPLNLDKALKDENISGLTEPTDDVINFSKDDNEIVSDIINDVRERKIELWQTPEGQQRLQKMIDNTPSLKGQTPDSLIEGVASMTNLNNFYAEDLATKETIQSQMNKVDSLHEQGLISDTDYFNQSVALDDALKNTELSIAESEKMLNKHYGFYSGEANTMGIQPGAWKNEDIAKVGSHELGHFLGSFGIEGKAGTTYLDDKLKALKLVPDAPEQMKMEFPMEPNSKSAAYNKMGEGRGNYVTRSKNYFENGSGGSERVPFLAEVREDMLQKGIIKSEYDKITPKMLKDHYKDYKNTRGEKYPLRVYDIIKNDPENFDIMSDVLKYLPVVSTAATVYDQLDGDDKNSVTEASMLGFMGLLTKKPASFKMPKKLQGIVNNFKKYGNVALKELKTFDRRYLSKEIDKMFKEFDDINKELGYTYNEPGLVQEQTRLENLVNTRNRKFRKFFKDRELRAENLDPNDELAQYYFPEAERKVMVKKTDIDQYDKAANAFRIIPEGIESTGASMFEGVTTTGQKKITDLSTGQQVNAEVRLPSYREEYKIVDGQLVKSDFTIDQPLISTEYVTALKNSRNDVEAKIPGAKVFGSSVLVTEAGMPHITGDIDVLISQSDYNKNVKNNFPFVQDYGPAKQHAIYKDYGQEGVLDFNIIHEDGNGNVIPFYNPNLPDKTPTEIELFRQFYPDKFQEASAKAATTGKPLEINMSSKEFMAGIDPQVKTVIDSYETSPFNKWGQYNANKEKHILRPDVLIAYGNPEVVSKGQEAYIKSIVGSKGSLGHQFSEQALSDVNKNIDALLTMDFKGDVLQTAQDPKRMQLALNDYYINNTVFSREIGEANLPGRKYTEPIIHTALTEWFPGKAGSFNGIGLNTVQKGNPNHVIATDNPIIGHRQLGLKLDTNDPVSYVNSIVRGTSGNYVFTPEEVKLIEDLADKYIPEVRSQMRTNFKARDILDWYPNVNFDKSKDFLDELSQQTGIRAIRKDEASGGYRSTGAAYASILGTFDETVDAMMYSLKKYHASPKTLNERKRAFDTQKAKQSTPAVKLKTLQDFKKIYGVLDGGLATANARLANYADQLASLNAYKENLIQNMSSENDIYLKEVTQKMQDLEKRKWDINTQIARFNTKRDELKVLYKILGFGSLGAGLVASMVTWSNDVDERNKKQIEEARKRNDTLRARGIDPKSLTDPYLSKLATDYIRNNPSAKHWPTGEKIEVKSDSSIVFPVSTTLKKGDVVWDMNYRKQLNKKSLGGENEIELELTQKEIDDLVSRGYIVVQK